MKKGYILVLLTMLSIIEMAGANPVHNINKGTDYATIQAAIDDANIGDEIHADNGTYNEKLNINKRLKIVGENRKTTIIKGNNNGEVVILTANNIVVQGFNITGSGNYWYDAGIASYNNGSAIKYNIFTGNERGVKCWYSNCKVDNNIFTENRNDAIYGVYSTSIFVNNTVIKNNIHGIVAHYPKNGTIIKNNIVKDNIKNGIVILDGSNKVIIDNNNAINNSIGIYEWRSSKNSITNNKVKNNSYGIGVYDSSRNNLMTDNTIYNNILSGIILSSSDNNIIYRNSILKTYEGIMIYYSNKNIIRNNTISNNSGSGIRLSRSKNNIINGNKVFKNGWGIYLDYSSNNNLLNNNNVSFNSNGINLHQDSNTNMLRKNIIISNNDGGIILKGVLNNTIIDNTFIHDGIGLEDSYLNKVINNTVNQKPLVYLENKSNYIIKNAGQVILVNSNNITIKNMNLSNTLFGVELWKTGNSKILLNNFYNNAIGIVSILSNKNIVNNNKFFNNDFGIIFVLSDNNSIYGNTVNTSHYHGIILDRSNNNNLNGSIVSKNFNGVGIGLSGSINNLVNANIANYNGIGIDIGKSNNNKLIGNEISNNYAGIWLDYSNSNTLKFNKAMKNIKGLWLSDSNYNILNSNFVIQNNFSGIDLSSFSNKNVLTNNTILKNSLGIGLYSSNYNMVYNNFFNNKNNSVIINSTNKWNVTRKLGKNIVGGPYIGGNFWAYPNGTGFSQKCKDNNNDGICDSRYIINSQNIDYLPLAEKPVNNFQYPLDIPWKISLGFGKWVNNWDGKNSSGYHLAEDVPAKEYTPVNASSNGTVRYTSTNIGGYGSIIIIEHPNSNVTTLYGHLSRYKGLKVKIGQNVIKGQLIGYIGNDSENGIGKPHIHFGIRKGLYSTTKICGKWPYVGYSLSCTNITHQKYLNMWYNSSEFVKNN